VGEPSGRERIKQAVKKSPKGCLIRENRQTKMLFSKRHKRLLSLTEVAEIRRILLVPCSVMDDLITTALDMVAGDMRDAGDPEPCGFPT